MEIKVTDEILQFLRLRFPGEEWLIKRIYKGKLRYVIDAVGQVHYPQYSIEDYKHIFEPEETLEPIDFLVPQPAASQPKEGDIKEHLIYRQGQWEEREQTVTEKPTCSCDEFPFPHYHGGQPASKTTCSCDFDTVLMVTGCKCGGG